MDKNKTEEESNEDKMSFFREGLHERNQLCSCKRREEVDVMCKKMKD